MNKDEIEVYLRLKKMCTVDLPTDEQALGAVKVTWALVEEGVISASRAAELCGIKLLEYRRIIKKHCEVKNDCSGKN